MREIPEGERKLIDEELRAMSTEVKTSLLNKELEGKGNSESALKAVAMLGSIAAMRPVESSFYKRKPTYHPSQVKYLDKANARKKTKTKNRAKNKAARKARRK